MFQDLAGGSGKWVVCSHFVALSDSPGTIVRAHSAAIRIRHNVRLMFLRCEYTFETLASTDIVKGDLDTSISDVQLSGDNVGRVVVTCESFRMIGL